MLWAIPGAEDHQCQGRGPPPDWGQGAGQPFQRQVTTGFDTIHVRSYWSNGWGTLPKDLDAGLDAELLVSSLCLKLLSLSDIFLPSLQIFTENSHIKTEVLSLEKTNNQTLNNTGDYRFKRLLTKRTEIREC